MNWKWQGNPGEGYSKLYLALVPVAIRRQGGYWRWLRFRLGWGQFRALCYRTRHRLDNRFWDWRAVRAGYCNAKTEQWNGGYANWRCALPAKHLDTLPHRFNNYIWGVGERVEYSPILGDELSPRQGRIPERHMIRSLRDQRAFRRDVERRSGERGAVV